MGEELVWSGRKLASDLLVDGAAKMIRSMTLAVILVFTGCSWEVDKSDLPGIYEFEENGVKQQVTMMANGEYTNALYVKDTLSWTDTGNWNYEEHAGEIGVCIFKIQIWDKGYSPWARLLVCCAEKDCNGAKAALL